MKIVLTQCSIPVQDTEFSMLLSRKVLVIYSKTCLKRLLQKKTKIGFQDRLLLNAGQQYCRMLHGEHSAILSTFINLLFVIKIFVLSIFEWPFKTGFTAVGIKEALTT